MVGMIGVEPTKAEPPVLQTGLIHHLQSIPFVINSLSPKGIYIEAYDFMNLDHRAEQKLKRLKRRNFVAKNNKHRAKRHASIKQYTRKPKYQGSLNES